jgi:hypothetical protein
LRALAGPTAINDVAVTRSTTNGSLVHVDATISGAGIVNPADVLVTYTAVGTNRLRGTWSTCNLIPGRTGAGSGETRSCPNAQITTVSDDERTFVRHYSADIELADSGAAQTDVRVLIQAVSGTGLVSVATNNGEYYQVADKPTISAPKTATVLSLTRPISPNPYDHAATFKATVSDRWGKALNGQVVFTVGSQRKTVQTTGGVATATMVIQALPGAEGGESRNYPVTAAFLETATLLPSLATAEFVVTKQPTSLTFGATPFLVTLTDQETPPHLLRDVTVFFDVSDPAGGPVLQTLSAQTGVDGVAQLRGLTVPAGTYKLTAYFLGKVPHDGIETFATLVDDRYSASSVTTTVAFDPAPARCDLTPPSIAGGFIEVTVEDRNSGLVSVTATELVNATLTFTPARFVNGYRGVVTARATKIDRALSSQLGLQVVNAAGKVTYCDPVSVVLDSRGVHSKITVYDVKPEEHFVVIYNGQPGLSGLRVKVNQYTWRVRGLRPGEVRTLDIARALHFDEPNTITLIGEGPPGGSAMILIGDMEPASATLRRAQREHSDPDEDR